MSVLSLIPEERKKCINGNGIYSSNPLRYSCVLQKKKTLHPLLLSASNMSANLQSNEKRYVAKRILSAKEHKIKHLQNRLADAHFHLTELSNENRLLRNLQKRQESALLRYENSHGEIPQLINSHTEEVRAWQVRFKQIKSQFKEVSQRLKDKENELQQLSDDHKHLLALSKDLNLEEREKLQNEVVSLKTKIEKQSETINSLQRKILIETKNFKHHLHSEVSKQKDMQQKLLDANKRIEKLSATVETKDRCLMAAAMKRNVKKPFNLSNSHKLPSLSNESIVTNNKVASLGSDLSIQGSSVADNIKYSDVSSSSHKSNNSTFTINKKVTNGNIASMTNNVNHNNATILPSIDNHSASSSDPVPSSDEDVKTRISLLKQQFQNREENSVTQHFPQSTNNEKYSSSLDSSSPDDFTEFYNKIDKPEKEMKSSDTFNDENYIHHLKSKLSEYSINQMSDDLRDMEIKARLQNDETQNILGKFCDTVVRNAQISISSDTATSTPKSDVLPNHWNDNKKKNDLHKELNNNNSLSNKKLDDRNKTTSDLNDEKKKKLLAALDAIDKGEEKVSSLDILKNINTNRTNITLSSNKLPFK